MCLRLLLILSKVSCLRLFSKQSCLMTRQKLTLVCITDNDFFTLRLLREPSDLFCLLSTTCIFSEIPIMCCAGRYTVLLLTYSTTPGESVPVFFSTCFINGLHSSASASIGGNRPLTSIAQLSQRDRAAVWFSCLLYTSPSPRDGLLSRMPSSA